MVKNMITLDECLQEANTIKGIIFAVLEAKDYPNRASNRNITVGYTIGGSKCYTHPCGGILILNKVSDYPFSMYNDICLAHNRLAKWVTKDSSAVFCSQGIKEKENLEYNINEETFFQLSTIHDDITLRGIVVCSILRDWGLPPFSIQHSCVAHGVEKWTEEWMNTQGPKWI